MKKWIAFFSVITISTIAIAQSKPAYVLYNAKGKKISYKKMLQTIVQKDMVMIGEFHNNPISHWMELEITKDCGASRKLVLGAEMFEQDNQQALDQYLQGNFSAKWLDSNARLWKNYPTDYAPLVNYAKENKLAFAASNVPRRYASMVFRGGFEALDTLPANQKAWIAPLPIAYDSTLPGYKNMISMMGSHGSSTIAKAQAI